MHLFPPTLNFCQRYSLFYHSISTSKKKNYAKTNDWTTQHPPAFFWAHYPTIKSAIVSISTLPWRFNFLIRFIIQPSNILKHQNNWKKGIVEWVFLSQTSIHNLILLICKPIFITIQNSSYYFLLVYQHLAILVFFLKPVVLTSVWQL